VDLLKQGHYQATSQTMGFYVSAADARFYVSAADARNMLHLAIIQVDTGSLTTAGLFEMSDRSLDSSRTFVVNSGNAQVGRYASRNSVASTGNKAGKLVRLAVTTETLKKSQEILVVEKERRCYGIKRSK
jgi:hypothetical protein